MPIHLLTGLAAAALGPGTFQDLNALDARVAAVLAGSGTAVPIDPRIKLAACPEEPLISPMPGGSVSVRCPARGWKIRVAVEGTHGAAAPSEPVVHRGDTIELTVEGAGYSASSVGTALDEGGAGNVIRVKIPTSAAPVPATIRRAGVATISD